MDELILALEVYLSKIVNELNPPPNWLDILQTFGVIAAVITALGFGLYPLLKGLKEENRMTLNYRTGIIRELELISTYLVGYVKGGMELTIPAHEDPLLTYITEHYNKLELYHSQISVLLEEEILLFAYVLRHLGILVSLKNVKSWLKDYGDKTLKDVENLISLMAKNIHTKKKKHET